MTLKPLYTNADQPQHRIAVVVFTTVRAVDYGDGAGIVEDAVRKLVREAPGNYTPQLGKSIVFERERTDATWQVPIEVHAIRELSMAAGNGYVTVVPSAVAYRGDER